MMQDLKIQVNDLTGPDLCWYVGAATREVGLVDRGGVPAYRFRFDPERHAEESVLGTEMAQFVHFRPDIKQDQGGYIIDTWRIATEFDEETGSWKATLKDYTVGLREDKAYLHTLRITAMNADTRLLAAMRCLVVHVFGTKEFTPPCMITGFPGMPAVVEGSVATPLNAQPEHLS